MFKKIEEGVQLHGDHVHSTLIAFVEFVMAKSDNPLKTILS
jgi:hypothetical protein